MHKQFASLLLSADVKARFEPTVCPTRVSDVVHPNLEWDRCTRGYSCTSARRPEELVVARLNSTSLARTQCVKTVILVTSLRNRMQCSLWAYSNSTKLQSSNVGLKPGVIVIWHIAPTQVSATLYLPIPIRNLEAIRKKKKNTGVGSVYTARRRSDAQGIGRDPPLVTTRESSHKHTEGTIATMWMIRCGPWHNLAGWLAALLLLGTTCAAPVPRSEVQAALHPETTKGLERDGIRNQILARAFKIVDENAGDGTESDSAELKDDIRETFGRAFHGQIEHDDRDNKRHEQEPRPHETFADLKSQGKPGRGDGTPLEHAGSTQVSSDAGLGQSVPKASHLEEDRLVHSTAPREGYMEPALAREPSVDNRHTAFEPENVRTESNHQPASLSRSSHETDIQNDEAADIANGSDLSHASEKEASNMEDAVRALEKTEDEVFQQDDGKAKNAHYKHSQSPAEFAKVRSDGRLTELSSSDVSVLDDMNLASSRSGSAQPSTDGHDLPQDVPNQASRAAHVRPRGSSDDSESAAHALDQHSKLGQVPSSSEPSTPPGVEENVDSARLSFASYPAKRVRLNTVLRQSVLSTDEAAPEHQDREVSSTTNVASGSRETSAGKTLDRGPPQAFETGNHEAVRGRFEVGKEKGNGAALVADPGHSGAYPESHGIGRDVQNPPRAFAENEDQPVRPAGISKRNEDYHNPITESHKENAINAASGTVSAETDRITGDKSLAKGPGELQQSAPDMKLEKEEDSAFGDQESSRASSSGMDSQPGRVTGSTDSPTDSSTGGTPDENAHKEPGRMDDALRDQRSQHSWEMKDIKSQHKRQREADLQQSDPGDRYQDLHRDARSAITRSLDEDSPAPMSIWRAITAGISKIVDDVRDIRRRQASEERLASDEYSTRPKKSRREASYRRGERLSRGDPDKDVDELVDEIIRQVQMRSSDEYGEHEEYLKQQGRFEAVPDRHHPALEQLVSRALDEYLEHSSISPASRSRLRNRASIRLSKAKSHADEMRDY